MHYIEQQREWNWSIAAYLFLSGTGGGAYLISILVNGFISNMQSVVKLGLSIGSLCVLAGVPLLVLDLGRKKRMFFIGMNIKSAWISRGFYFIILFLVVSVLQFALWIWPFNLLEKMNSIRIIFELTTAILAFCIIVYTGFLMSSMKSIEFWNTPILEFLFFFSAILSGSSALILFSYVLDYTLMDITVSLFMIKINLLIMLALFLSLLFMLYSMKNFSKISRYSVYSLLNGKVKYEFWIGIVTCTLILPFLLYMIVLYDTERYLGLFLPTSIFTLIGGYYLRHGILVAGYRIKGIIPGAK